MLHEGMYVKSIAEFWSIHSADGVSPMRLGIGTKLTVSKTYYIGGIQFAEFEEYPNLGWMSSGFKAELN